MKKFIAAGIIGIMLFATCTKDKETDKEVHSTFTDARDSVEYEVVTIGDQVWFAENLRFEKDSSLCYDDLSINCFIYGRLYTGPSAQTACPEGWHLPTVDEWEELIDYLGGIQVAGLLLQPDGRIGDKLVGFNSLPAGRAVSDSKELGVKAYFTTSTPAGYPDSYRIYSISIDGEIQKFGTSDGSYQSCRCVQDEL